jgi:hypothetical protein
MVRGKDSD